MKRSIIAVMSVLAVMWLAAGGVRASTYLIEHSHTQGFTGNVSFNSGASKDNVWLGRFLMEPITPAVPPNSTLPPVYPIYNLRPPHGYGPEMGFYSYCLEPLQPIGAGHGTSYQYPFSIVSLDGTDGIDAGDAALITELFGRYCPLLQNDPTGPTGSYTGGTFRTAAAALQLAIWKINLDRGTSTLGSWNFTSGLMRIAPGDITVEKPDPQPPPDASRTADAVALDMLNSLTGSGPAPSALLQGLANPTYQDLIIQMPEPATVAFLALGGIGMLVRRRRK